VCLQYFDTVGWVLRPVKNRRPYNLYSVGGDVKPCSINQSISERLINTGRPWRRWNVHRGTQQRDYVIADRCVVKSRWTLHWSVLASRLVATAALHWVCCGIG